VLCDTIIAIMGYKEYNSGGNCMWYVIRNHVLLLDLLCNEFGQHGLLWIKIQSATVSLYK
jgi:hypothetical protein